MSFQKGKLQFMESISKQVIGVLSILFLISTFACKREGVLETDPNQQPVLTKDSIIFDTVFTTVGTTTEFFKVLNPSNKSLKMDQIYLAGGENSDFRLNVDGEPGKSFSNITLRPKDSIFVFVEATIDPNGGNTPLIVEDQIVFETLGKTKAVELLAWGQDAIYHRADTYIAGLPPFVVLPENEIWTSEKPHVVYGYAVVDSARSLRVEAGTQIHFHNNSGLWVYRGGHIEMNGTTNQPIVLQGDRLESFFEDAPGQWDRFWINEGPQDHILRNVIIKNALVGLQIEPLPFDVLSPTTTNKIILENVTIQNSSAIGLLARNYRMEATNCVFGDAGTYGFAISGGGSYDLNHVTIANYYIEKPRTDAGVLVTNVYEDATGTVQIRPLEMLRIRNSIIAGSQETEIEFSLNEEVTNQIEIANSLIFLKEDFSDFYVNCSRNLEPAFKNPDANNFDIKSNSFAIDRGIQTGINTDILGRFRDFNPDLGAYEFDTN